MLDSVLISSSVDSSSPNLEGMRYTQESITVTLTKTILEHPVMQPSYQVSLIQDVIENLLNRIDFQEYENAYSIGNLSDDEFDQIATNMISNKLIEAPHLIDKITAIFPYIKNKDRIGTELFSTLFQCDISLSRIALGQILSHATSLTIGGNSD